MGEQRVPIDAVHDEAEPVRRSVQDLWREQNAAFRARALSQLRTARPRLPNRDEQRARPA